MSGQVDLSKCYDASRLKMQRWRDIVTGAARDVGDTRRQRWMQGWLDAGLISEIDCKDAPPRPTRAKPAAVSTTVRPARQASKSSFLDCVHRGTALHALSVPGCPTPPVVYSCALHSQCVLIADSGKRGAAVAESGLTVCRSCPKRQPPGADKPVGAAPRRRRAKPDSQAKPRQSKRHPFHWAGKTPEFVTTAQLMADVKRLVSMLPPDTNRIVGVARSGLCAATMAAMLMHRPLEIVRQSAGDLIDGGNGWRLTGATHSDGPVVVVDDTCMTGNSFRHIMPVVRAQHPSAMSAVVYCNPNANTKPDLWARELPHPHLLEWNMFNSIFGPGMALDFDGILCHDCPAGHDDDGPRYAAFLRDAKPLYYFRRVQIPLIVTARLEKYREPTLAWLKRHGMSVRELAMWPGSYRDRSPERVAQHKASHYKRFAAKGHRLKPVLLVESDPWQAKRIAELSGGITCCPAAGRCFP